MQSYLALILGAIIGFSIRYLFYLINLSAFGIPLSTIIVNVIGSSLAGFFYGKFQNSAYVFMYVGTHLCLDRFIQTKMSQAKPSKIMLSQV